MNFKEIDEFMQVTGCSRDETCLWLDMSNNNVANAVEMYFNSNAMETENVSEVLSNETSTNGSTRNNATNVDIQSNYPDYDIEGIDMDDAIYARQLQNEEERKNDAQYQEESVRAADSSKISRLVPDQEFGAMLSFRMPLLEGASIGGLPLPYVIPERNITLNPPLPPTNGMWETTSSGSAPASNREKTLESMYKINTNLLYRGDFNAFKAFAKASDKWCLVVLHNESDFKSHIMNRDVWSDELVEEVVNCFFVFWYRQDTSPDGKLIMERYNVPETPYIGIIDPRTGSLVKCFSGSKGVPSSAGTMVERLNDFTDRYPNPSAYTHANVVVSQTTSINEDTCNDAQAKMVSDITSEDEDLQAALALSMPVNTMNTNTNTKVRGDENAVVASSSVSVAVGSGGPSDIVGFVCAHYLNATHRNSDLNTNATSTGEAFRIQFKLKNRKIVKKFNGDDNVFDLLACVAALVVDESPSEPPVGFDLLFGYPTTNSFFSLLTNPDGSADIDTSILLSNFKTELYNSQIVIKLL